jgi:hypothetical protein
MTSPTASMIAKVKTYCTSSTVKVPAGGTKVKSKVATHRTAVATAGPRL